MDTATGEVVHVYGHTGTPEEMAAQFDQTQIAFMQGIPFWAHAANAIAVVAGVAGCVLLLMRKTLALPVFIVSLVALGVAAYALTGAVFSDEREGLRQAASAPKSASLQM